MKKTKFILEVTLTPAPGKSLRKRGGVVNPFTMVMTFSLLLSLLNLVGISQDSIPGGHAIAGVMPWIGMGTRENMIIAYDTSSQPRTDEHPHLNLTLANMLDEEVCSFQGERDWVGECKNAFEYLNSIRKGYSRTSIKWDERAYYLAVSRSKDMFEKGYFDHVTPEGTCVKDMKGDYGFYSAENLAENIGILRRYKNGMPTSSASPANSIDRWMTSRGHRYNLLYEHHDRGAVGCYKSICTFIGVNHEPLGLGKGECTNGEVSLLYWQTTGKRPDEI
ncbi:MAG: hypothetical protein GF416_02665 [Candidatus Altiarchaeales archaeon]|nr:hypothetical protein [Candidatus Altiarchaeales archaeon]MBD3416022.1 hypothetical protein [Candidatus Altiarchaeales archaeon]